VSSSDGAPSTASGWIKVVIGALFLALGIKQWSNRPKAGEDASVPAWMSKIDDFTATKAFGAGVLLSAVNPKNLGLTLAAAATIGGSGLSTGDEYVVLLSFVVVASLTVATPVILNLVLGSRAETTLTSMKQWLTANNNTVMSVLFVVLGANVIGNGLAILA
jgi:threonine/homoserine/homoserine lactone efflux protein